MEDSSNVCETAANNAQNAAQDFVDTYHGYQVDSNVTTLSSVVDAGWTWLTSAIDAGSICNTNY